MPENKVGSVLLLLFQAVMFLVAAVVLIWELGIFEPSNKKEFRFKEWVEIGGGKFVKFGHFEFLIDEQNQRVIQKIIAPSILANVEFDKKRAKWLKREGETPPSSMVTLIRATLPNGSMRLKVLSECVVFSGEDWFCDDTVNGIALSKAERGIGMQGGNWTGNVMKFFENSLNAELVGWKVSWEFDKFRCSELCYYGTVDENRKAMSEFLKN